MKLKDFKKLISLELDAWLSGKEEYNINREIQSDCNKLIITLKKAKEE